LTRTQILIVVIATLIVCAVVLAHNRAIGSKQTAGNSVSVEGIVTLDAAAYGNEETTPQTGFPPSGVNPVGR